MNLTKYLNRIQNDSVGSFAIDSIPKKNKIVRQFVSEEKLERRNRVMVDFDRTIHQYSKGWQDGTIYDPPFPGAKEALQLLKSKGYEIIIFTTRVSPEQNLEKGRDVREQLISIQNWLAEYDIPYDRITAEKLDGDFYIDDKAICIRNGDWKSVLEEIEERSGEK